MRRRILLCIVSFMLIFNMIGISGVSAADTEYKKFCQSDKRWGSYVYGGGTTLANSGCMITAIAVLMAYANPELRDVKKFNPKTLAQDIKLPDSLMRWERPERADSTFKLVKNDDTDRVMGVAAKEVKKHLDAGRYVVIKTTNLYSGSHYSPVVGWADGEPLVMDVARGKQSNWEIWAKGRGITHMLVYESSITKSNEVLENDKSAVAVGSSSGTVEEEKKEIDALVKEWELEGMPIPHGIGQEVDLPDSDTLSQEEIVSMETIKEDIESHKRDRFSIVFTIVSFLGLFVIVYGVLLAVAYLFDRTNNILEISLLSILTIGRYRMWDETYGVRPGYSESEKVMYCNSSVIVKRLIIMELVGFMLVSGYALDFVYEVFLWVREFLGIS